MDDTIYEEKKTNKKIDIPKLSNKTIIIIIIAIIVLIVIVLLLKDTKNETCSIEIANPIVMYMDEPLDIPVKIKSSTTDTNEIMTFATPTTDEIITIEESDFTGSKGSFLIVPQQTGEEEIDIISSIGVDKYSKTLNTKQTKVIVCSKFDENLLHEKNILVRPNETSKLKLNFENDSCYKYITYESEDEQIATITNDGTITGITPGTTKIIISNGTEPIYVNVNVD